MERWRARRRSSDESTRRFKRAFPPCSAIRWLARAGDSRAETSPRRSPPRIPIALKAVERAAHYLGLGLGGLVNVLGPEVVIIGGGVVNALGDPWIDSTAPQLEHRSLPTPTANQDLPHRTRRRCRHPGSGLAGSEHFVHSSIMRPTPSSDKGHAIRSNRSTRTASESLTGTANFRRERSSHAASR